MDDFLASETESEEEAENVGKKRKKKSFLVKGMPRHLTRVWAYYWGSHQRFFQQMCSAAKVREP
jgi:hypothetical protein